MGTIQSQSLYTASLVPRPSYHGVPVRGPGNSGLRMRLIKTNSWGRGDVNRFCACCDLVGGERGGEDQMRGHVFPH